MFGDCCPLNSGCLAVRIENLSHRRANVKRNPDQDDKQHKETQQRGEHWLTARGRQTMLVSGSCLQQLSHRRCLE